MKNFNVITILTDKQRPDSISYYNEHTKCTPNLDKLAEDSINYLNAYTTCPSHIFAQMTLNTGKYPSVFLNQVKEIADGKLEISDKDVPSLFKDENYHTKRVNIDIVDEINNSDCETDILAYLDSVKDKSPISVIPSLVNSTTPQAPYIIRPEEENNPFYLQINCINDVTRYNNIKVEEKDFIPQEFLNKAGDWYFKYHDYLNYVQKVDYLVGRLINKLIEMDEYDNTIIVFTSGSGCHFRTRNSSYNASCHDASLHVPLMIKSPKITECLTTTEQVSLIDIIPSILNLCNIDIPDYIQGNDLFEEDLVYKLLASKDNCIFSQICKSEIGRVLRTERWKYEIISPESYLDYEHSSPTYIESSLYDLENDPEEIKNLICDPYYKLVRMRLRVDISKLIFEYDGNSEYPLIRTNIL